jgi:glycosyltransferase involved in cell wall biosynthesis
MKRIWLAFTQNETQRTILEREFQLPSRRMISGHPIPAKPLPAERKLESPIVLWAGNLGLKKRPEKFIELAQLAQNTNLQFVMMGGHANSGRTDTLFARTPPNLTWLGRLSFDNALNLFDRAAFFVNTSTVMAEGFPNTFIQAWLRGIPVLSLDVDPDGIIKRSGVGLAPATLPEMLEFMRSLVIDRPAYLRISTAASSLAAKNFSVEYMADHFLEQLHDRGSDAATHSGPAGTHEKTASLPRVSSEAGRG